MKKKVIYQIQEWYPQWTQWNNYDAPNPDRKSSIENFNETQARNPDQIYQLVKIETVRVLPKE